MDSSLAGGPSDCFEWFRNIYQPNAEGPRQRLCYGILFRADNDLGLKALPDS
jgi:hypothetical protein